MQNTESKVNKSKITLTFVTREEQALSHLKSQLSGIKSDVEFSYSSSDISKLTDLQYDILVSPANSYGDLSGGIDKTFYNLLGKKALQEKVIRYINEYEHGEIHVGSYGTVPIGYASVSPKYLVLAPTMVIPTSLQKDSRNPYLFMRAVIKAVRNIKNKLFKNQNLTVLCPIPCIGVGAMNFINVCKQIKIAVESMNKTGIIYQINMSTMEDQNSSIHSFMYANLPIQNMKMANIYLTN